MKVVAKIVAALAAVVIAGAYADDSAAAPMLGSKPFVSLLCQFADPGPTPHPREWYVGLMGETYPGMGHYWRQQSYGAMNLSGSTVRGWYRLPRTVSGYLTLGSEFDDQILKDCTGIAESQGVNFPSFYGINLFLSMGWPGGTASGDFPRSLTRNGQTRNYGVTWIDPAGAENQNVTGHEMGHALGLKHSSGPYSTAYDSQWDVMSAGGGGRAPHPTYHYVGVHTIAYHKDVLGWIPSSRKYTAAVGTTRTITLERLGEPISSNYLMAHVPIPGSTRFFTVESRRFGTASNYDSQLPAEAVVIHEVDVTRDRNARVVDPDGDGDPNDESAQWAPGETFTSRGATVRVDSATASGFVVTISVVTPPVPPSGPRLGDVTTSSVQFRWNDNSANESHFEVLYRPSTSSKPWRITVPANATSWTHTGLAPGARNLYSVRACNAAGCSAPTSEIVGLSALYRIVLTWQAMPHDLNANLWVPLKLFGGTVYSRVGPDQPGSMSGIPFAKHKGDDQLGYGPEEIVIGAINTAQVGGTYAFAVYNNPTLLLKSAPTLAGSNAAVRLYRGTTLLRTFTAPAAGSGRWWDVFRLRSDGTITAVNQIVTNSPAP
jgi:M6 family metalloprotease-like protein